MRFIIYIDNVQQYMMDVLQEKVVKLHHIVFVHLKQ